MSKPKWFDRFVELRKSKLKYHEIATALNAEGFTATHGGEITVDTLRCFVSNGGAQRVVDNSPNPERLMKALRVGKGWSK